MAYAHIALTRDGHVATLMLNRPDTRNAMSVAMGEEVRDAVEQVRDDREVRVLVIIGAGRAFSSGGDLGMLAADAGLAEHDAGMGGPPREFYARYLSVATLEIPTLAAINGHAVGAGLCFALACDLRLAAADAKLGMTFTRLGIHPGMGATYFLPRLIGEAPARDLLFTGRLVDAGEAARLGLVNRVVERDEFPAAVAAYAGELAAAAPIAVRLVKRALQRSARQTLADALDLESLQQRATFATEDAREGIRAIMAKRTPEFRNR